MSQLPQRKSDSKSAGTSLVNQQIGEYQVVKLLGRGGMGMVYLVRHSLTMRLEALKVLRKSLVARPNIKERFLREVQVAAKLHHPNVVTTFNAIQSGEVLGMVMEYVEGQDLEHWVKQSGPLSVQAAATVIYQAALGLQHAADHGLTHRDIKPSNVLIAQGGEQLKVKLTDFGLSKLNEDSGDRGLTLQGRLIGTPDYMAPEQGLDATRVTIAADIYGLGCSLFYALVGRPPYQGGSPIAVLNQHIQSPIPDLCSLRPDVPVGLGRLFVAMVQKDPTQRVATPAAVAAAILPFTVVNAGVSASPIKQTGSVPTLGDQAASPIASSLVDTSASFDTRQGLSLDPTASAAASSAPTRDAASVRGGLGHQRGTTTVRRPRAKGKKQINWSLFLQLAMPLIFALVVALYLRSRPFAVAENVDGTLVVKELSAGTRIDIDGTIEVAAENVDKAVREIRLSPGSHRLRFLHGDTVIMQQELKISSNQRTEVLLSYLGRQNSRSPEMSPRPPVPEPVKRPADKQDNLKVASSNDNDGATMPGNGSDKDPEGTMRQAANDKSPAKTQAEPVKVQTEPVTTLTHAGWAVEFERQLTGLESSATALTFLPRGIAPQGNEVLVATGASIKAWDTKTGFPQSLTTPMIVNKIALAANEKLVFYANDFHCEIWTVQKNPLKWFETPANANTRCVFSLSQDSRSLGCVDYNQSFLKWDLQTKAVAATMTARRPQPKDNVQQIQLTPKLDRVLVAGHDGTLACWNTVDGEEVGRATPDDKGFDDVQIVGMHIHGLGKKIVVTRRSGQIETRSYPGLELIAKSKPAGDTLVASASGIQVLAVANFSGTVTLLDPSEMKVLGSITGPNDALVTSVAISADSKWIAVGYSGGPVHLVRLKKLQSAASGGAASGGAASESTTEPSAVPVKPSKEDVQ